MEEMSRAGDPKNQTGRDGRREGRIRPGARRRRRVSESSTSTVDLSPRGRYAVAWRRAIGGRQGAVYNSTTKWTLEVVVVDVDRAKQFYADKVGFTVDLDLKVDADNRVVQ